MCLLCARWRLAAYTIILAAVSIVTRSMRCWHVPHFEKMLYDQAQLATAYLDAFQITHDPEFETVARGILDYVRRDMTSEGGFFSAEDADSLLESGRNPEHAEGAFYVWAKEEIDNALSKEAAKVFDFHYGIEDAGNAPAGSDPQGELRGKNILIARHSFAETAKHFDKSEDEIRTTLEKSRKILFALRANDRDLISMTRSSPRGMDS